MASEDSSSLTYYRLHKGLIKYGPYISTSETTRHEEASIETFEFCHQENTSSQEFSMTNEVSVSGVLKAFDIGASHSHTFANVSTEVKSTGKEVREFKSQFVTTHQSVERTIERGYFLASYSPVKVCCFTVNGGERQYTYIPAGNVIIKSMNADEIRDLINKGSFLVDKDSWAIVGQADMNFDNISELRKNLKPKNIEVAVPYGTYKIKTVKHDLSGMVDGWGLSAFMNHGAKRNDRSSWVAVHDGTEWPCLWELKPGREEGTFRIDTHAHVLGRQPAGWGLSAFRITTAIRDNSSTRVCAHEGNDWPMDWKIVPGEKNGTWKIKTTDHFAGSQVAGWSLSAWGSKVKDTVRNGVSSWVHVHKEEHWSTDWVLEKQN